MVLSLKLGEIITWQRDFSNANPGLVYLGVPWIWMCIISAISQQRDLIVSCVLFCEACVLVLACRESHGERYELWTKQRQAGEKSKVKTVVNSCPRQNQSSQIFKKITYNNERPVFMFVITPTYLFIFCKAQNPWWILIKLAGSNRFVSLTPVVKTVSGYSRCVVICTQSQERRCPRRSSCCFSVLFNFN